MTPHASSAEQPGSLAVNVVAALDRLARARRALRRAAATRHGLSPLQADLLVTLAAGPPPEPTVGRLAGEMAVSQPTVTESLRALVAKGLAERRRGRADRRSSHVVLTPAGRRLAATLGRGDDIAAAVDGLPPPVQEATLETLLTLIARTVDAGAVDTARSCLTCRFHRADRRTHRCELLAIRFSAADLRVNCGDHEAA